MSVHQYKYPRPKLAVDCVVFGFDGKEELKILLIRRLKEPFRGKWALPGGFVRIDQDPSIDFAARRELKEETMVDDLVLEQFHTFGSKDRHPNDWVATVAYYSLVNLSAHPIGADTDVDKVGWFSIERIPALAFDHSKIIGMALSKLRHRVRYEPIGFRLLPNKFTLPQLQGLYEAVLGTQLDRRNFLRKFRKMDLLVELDESQKGVSHRPAKLYKFDAEKYEKLKEQEFNFEI